MKPPYRMTTTLMLAGIGFCLNVVSCTTREAYHLHEPVVQHLPAAYAAAKATSCTDCQVVQHRGFTLGHVELDDQRELFSHRQLAAVTAAIKKESTREDLLVMVFIHGWNNNSSGKRGQSESMRQFETMLHRMTEAQAQLHGRKPFGVFVSWRGKTLDLPFIHVLDYFHRNEAARRKGVAATEVLYDLGFSAKQANSNNRVVMFGHSMGALMLESAVSEGIGAEIVKRQAQGVRLDHTISPADLVLLANPAESAGESKALISLMKNRGVHAAAGGHRVDLPLIVSVSSKGDMMTRGVFNVATGVSRVLPFSTASSGSLRTRYEPEEDNGTTQRELWSRPAPHVHKLNSHDGLSPAVLRHDSLKANSSLTAVIKANLHPEHDASGFHFETVQGRYQVKRLAGFNNTPYWVFRVADQVIENHGDIWNDQMLALMTTLMNLRRPEAASTAPAPHASAQPAAAKLQLNLRPF